MVTALLNQIATNLANDHVYARKGTDTEKRVGPTRAVQAWLMTEPQVVRALATILVAALLLGCYLAFVGGWPIILIGAAALLCTLWYSAGPAALSYTGLADIFVLMFFGPIAVAGTVYLLVGVWSEDAMVIGLAPGLISTAVLAANNLRDYWTDAAVNKRTLVVRFGLLFGRIEYTCCLIFACVLPPFLSVTATLPLAIAGLGTLLFALPLLGRVWKATAAEDFVLLLPGAAKLLVVYTVSFGIGLFTV
jgi:1,4-dihydroxy-2-naphthoate octaprenyltransferase